MLRNLPIELHYHIWSYDNTPKLLYDKCMEELRKNIKYSVYEYQKVYEAILSFYPTNEELIECFQLIKKSKPYNSFLYCFKNIEYLIEKTDINIQYAHIWDNHIINMFYISKTYVDYKKEILLNQKINNYII